jgi:hypothetical protein
VNLRLTLLALLVANLLVLAWTQWIDTEPSLPAAVTTAMAVPASKPAPPVPPVAAEAAPEAPAAPPRCVSVGPFRDTTETTQAIEAFRAANYAPRSRAQTAQISDGYLVHIDTIGSAAEQRRVLTTLRQAGIQDAAPLADVEPRYMISVGVFSDRDRAERRAQQVRALRIDAKIDPHSRAATFYWLDMEQQAGDAGLRLDVLKGAGAPPGGLTITACPGAATSTAG